MFCLIYEFKVKAGREDHFRHGWRSLTEALYEECGSMGARLHLDDDGKWIAYAQWPDRHSWQQGESAIHDFLKDTHWDECLDSVHVLLKMTLSDDLLKSATATAEPSNMEASITP